MTLIVKIIDAADADAAADAAADDDDHDDHSTSYRLYDSIFTIVRLT